jgi:hypothetical protein
MSPPPPPPPLPFSSMYNTNPSCQQHPTVTQPVNPTFAIVQVIIWTIACCFMIITTIYYLYVRKRFIRLMRRDWMPVLIATIVGVGYIITRMYYDYVGREQFPCSYSLLLYYMLLPVAFFADVQALGHWLFSSAKRRQIIQVRVMDAFGNASSNNNNNQNKLTKSPLSGNNSSKKSITVAKSSMNTNSKLITPLSSSTTPMSTTTTTTTITTAPVPLGNSNNNNNNMGQSSTTGSSVSGLYDDVDGTNNNNNTTNNTGGMKSSEFKSQIKTWWYGFSLYLRIFTRPMVANNNNNRHHNNTNNNNSTNNNKNNNKDDFTTITSLYLFTYECCTMALMTIPILIAYLVRVNSSSHFLNVRDVKLN